MKGRSGRVGQDIVEFFDQFSLTRVPSDNSLRGDGAIWTDIKAIPAALSGEYSLMTLDDFHTIQGLVVNGMDHKGRLSRPASLDGGLAVSETSSNSPSRVDIRASSTGTFLTAPEQRSHYIYQESPRLELEASTPVIQEYSHKKHDDQQNSQVEGSSILDRKNAGSITSHSHGTLAKGVQVSRGSSQATATIRNDLLIDSAGSSKCKPVSFRIQDDRLKRPISPATYSFNFPSDNRTVAPHSPVACTKGHSSPLAVPSTPFAAELLDEELHSSDIPPSGHNKLQYSFAVDSPYPSQTRVSWRLGDEEGLESPTTENDKNRQRFLDWVKSVPEKYFSDEEPCTKQMREQKPSTENHTTVHQKNTKEGDTIKETYDIENISAFDRFWSKAGTKTITPGFFSPAKGHFSPPTSPDLQLQAVTATPSTAHTDYVGKSSVSQSVLTTDSEDSDLYWSSKGPLRDLYHEEVTRMAQQNSPPKRAASEVQRIKHSSGRHHESKVPQILSSSSFPSNLSSDELILGPVKSLDASVSLDHLRLAPISKLPTFDDHVHPAQRVNPYFNISDNVNDGITLVPQPREEVNTTPPKYEPSQYVYSTVEEAPRLSRNFAKSPMRDEFAEMAKEKSTKAALKKVRTLVLTSVLECVI